VNYCQNTNKKYARVDFQIFPDGPAATNILCVDENQHKGYGIDCDVRRMGDIVTALRIAGTSGPIRFFRYNPHGFKVDSVTKRTTKKEREARLLKTLRTICEKQGRGVEVYYFYYDVVDGELAITKERDTDGKLEYDIEFSKCIRRNLIRGCFC
jgi:hypothetical protein